MRVWYYPSRRALAHIAYIPPWILVYICLLVLFIKATDLEFFNVNINNYISPNVFIRIVHDTIVVADSQPLHVDNYYSLYWFHLVCIYCRFGISLIVILFFLKRHRHSNKLEAIMSNISCATRIPEALCYMFTCVFV